MQRAGMYGWLLVKCSIACATTFSATGCHKDVPTQAGSSSAAKLVEEQVTASETITAKRTQTEMGSGRSPFSIPDIEPVKRKEQLQTSVRLDDVSESVGLKHVYDNGATGRSLIAETIGGGVGWLDYDADGWVDLLANQAGRLASQASYENSTDALHRNLGHQFLDVTTSARLDDRFYSQGVSIGDFDNDGLADIYICNLGRNTLWMNLGDGTFQECGDSTGVAEARWSVSAAWCDLDRDGDLDLYVANYIEFDPADPQVCMDALGRPALCNIASFKPVPDTCYINNGDGRFVEAAERLRLAGPSNRALGVAVGDFNSDDWPDIYVANDTTANFLFINHEQGKRFEEVAALFGCDVDRAGGTQGSMGIAVGDVDGNGYLDLYCTNFYEESNTLYLNDGESGFRDVTALVGLHQPTLAMLGFGTLLQDWDADGSWELLVANGHVDNSPGNADNFAMLPQLFVQRDGNWYQAGEQAGDYFKRPRVGRGVAEADFDNDGAPDVVIAHQREPLSLLRNASTGGKRLSISLIGTRSNRSGLGCKVTVRRGEQAWMRETCGGTSYASSHQPRLFFGLGKSNAMVDVEVQWPSGVRQQMQQVAVDQELRLIEPWE